VRTIETDGSFRSRRRALAAVIEPLEAVFQGPASFLKLGGQTRLAAIALREIQSRWPPVPNESFGAARRSNPLARSRSDVSMVAPLCISVLSACPTGATVEMIPKRALLSFAEGLGIGVQCGLCKATGPEKVISLTPRLAFRAAAMTRVLKERRSRSTAFDAGKPSAPRQEHDRTAAVAGQSSRNKHWMIAAASFASGRHKMCETLPASPRSPRKGFPPSDP